MPIPSFSGLETALSGLEAAQAELNTTSNNISNESTPGYSREEVQTSPTGSLPLLTSGTSGHGAQLGEGVTVDDVTRVRDQFLDVQYRTQNSTSNSSSTLYNILNQVQTALGESDGTGLSTALNNFWSAWNDLGQGSTLASQQEVLSQAATVANALNQLSSQLTTIENQVYSPIGSTVEGQFNALTAYQGDSAGDANGPVASDATQIANLNGEIARAEASGASPNSLLDQRDSLIDDLSQYANVAVAQQGNGMVNVSFGNAAANPAADDTPLVEGTNANPSTNLNFTNLTYQSGGTLGALASLHDPNNPGNPQTLANYASSLDQVATQLTSQVQTALGGAGSTQFFINSGNPPAAATGAANIEVNPALSTGTGWPYSTVNTGSLTAGSSAAQQTYEALVTQIGTNVQSANADQTTQQSLLTAIGNQRESVSGVSLDEEMTNMITYQQAYQASARVMSAIDDTLQTLISMGSSSGM